jgi:hypothetical protein
MFCKSRALTGTVVLSAAALLSACGGGGGSDSGVTASAPVAVTSANAGQVAGAGVNASDGLTGNTQGILGIVPAGLGSGSPTDVNVVETLIEYIRNAPQYPDAGVQPAAVLNENQNCDSGNISVSFNDADNNLSLSTGDSVTMTANNCVLSGVMIDGSISMGSVVVSGDQFAPPYSLQFSLQTAGFSVSAGAETVSMRGAGTISELSNDGVSFTSSFTGSGIEITAGGETLSLTNYLITETENQATGAYSYAINATISSTSLGGSVQVTTEVTFSGTDPLDPDSGKLVCVGAGNTSVTLTVIDSDNVQLDVDSDGDGIVDATLMETWSSL